MGTTHLQSFKMPTPIKITSRISSITNAFVNSIIPMVKPTEEQVTKALSILEMLDGCQCSYCGSVNSEWDHLRPLVINKKPTGYISEIQNLVPSCGKCNQSKGNKKWEEWIMSDAPLSPKARGVADLEDRIKRLKKYEDRFPPTKVNLESIVDEDSWKQHWEDLEEVQKMMRDSQNFAEQISNQVALHIKRPT